MTNITLNHTAAKDLKDIIVRIENSQQKIESYHEDIKEAYDFAKANGYDAKIIKKVINRRKMDEEKKKQLEEEDDMISFYEEKISEV